MLKTILIAGTAVIIILAVIIMMRPDEFRVTRSITIAAPPAAIFAEVNDLHKWQAWSPWVRLDPNAKSSFEGPDSGTGAAMSWDGNNKVGKGKMTITQSNPGSLIRFRLDFAKPFAGTNTAEFIFKPEGNQTVVTWNMSGRSNFIAKAMSLIMDCEKIVGGQFEEGLNNLKAVVEKK